MDVVRVERDERAEHEDDLARAVGGRVEERRPRHLQRVLQRGTALGLARRARVVAQAGQRRHVLARIAAQVRHADADAVVHGENAELADGVLLEELAHVLLRVADRDQVPARPHVLVEHGLAQVEHQQHVSDDAALERGGVALFDSGGRVSILLKGRSCFLQEVRRYSNKPSLEVRQNSDSCSFRE